MVRGFPREFDQRDIEMQTYICSAKGLYASQDAKVDLKPLIVAVIPIYYLSETIILFFF